MNIALLGTRGIPARYGGFETFAEELSTRLAERGHRVTVYCRERGGATYRGVSLVYLPTIRHKYFDTLAHTLISTLHLVWHRADVALYCNAANACFTPLARLLQIPIALNVDGLERKRKKWNRLARGWYRLSEWLSTFCPTAMVTDAEKIQAYYLAEYGKESVFIPYGAAVGKVSGVSTLDQLRLEPGKYFLYVSRLEPENNGLLVREAFERVKTELKLALVGNAPYADAYIERIRDTSDARVMMPGAIYGEGYHELQSHCFAYIHATEVGGTHPALIEAMGRGAVILYLDTPENEEVAGGVGISFTHATLTEKIELVLGMTDPERGALAKLGMDRVKIRYSWDAVTDQYEGLLTGLKQRS